MAEKQTSSFTLSPDEQTAVQMLAAEHGLSEGSIIRQALRLYQRHNARLRNGETCHYSGDAERAHEFAGPLVRQAMGDIVQRCRSPEFADVAEKYLLAEAATEIEQLRFALKDAQSRLAEIRRRADLPRDYDEPYCHEEADQQ